MMLTTTDLKVSIRVVPMKEKWIWIIQSEKYFWKEMLLLIYLFIYFNAVSTTNNIPNCRDFRDKCGQIKQNCLRGWIPREVREK